MLIALLSFLWGSGGRGPRCLCGNPEDVGPGASVHNRRWGAWVSMWTYGGRGLRFLCGHLEVVGLGDLHRLHIRIATSMNYSNVIFTVKPDKESKLLVTVRQTPRKPTKERLSIYLCVLLKFLRRF